MAEQFGVQGRGAFHEEAGTIILAAGIVPNPVVAGLPMEEGGWREIC